MVQTTSIKVSSKFKYLTPYDPAVPLPGIYLREMKTYVHAMSCIWMLLQLNPQYPQTGNERNIHEQRHWANEQWCVHMRG